LERLASCCLLLIGFLNPLVSLPVTDSRDMPLQLPAPEDDSRLALEELERASILKLLPEVLGAGRGDGLLGAERGDGLWEAGQLSPCLQRLLPRPRKQHKQHGPPLECFWKYCV
uniref:Urotensin-2 n=1 Tax=Spermophilus dauricus TaxID=99837 RepID=A0A8C9QLV0_SPEDA